MGHDMLRRRRMPNRQVSTWIESLAFCQDLPRVHAGPGYADGDGSFAATILSRSSYMERDMCCCMEEDEQREFRVLFSPRFFFVCECDIAGSDILDVEEGHFVARLRPDLCGK